MPRLRVATIGAGYFSAFHHDAWSRIPVVELVAVCDDDPSKAETYAECFAIPRAFSNAALMLDEVQPDLLDIATPPPSHLALIQATMARRLPTICQKAFCRSRPFASNAETEIVYAWNDQGFAGDSVKACRAQPARDS